MKRGEIYYISRSLTYSNIGSEQDAGRPAIIVSNNKNNENSEVIEVVFLTTQDKPELPTHVPIRSSRKPSTALCEQVNSISVERVGDYIGEATEAEMEAIDRALMISLGLNVTEEPTDTVVMVEDDRVDELCQRVIILDTERNTYKRLYEDLLNRLIAK